jgi:hypothetical protein
MGARLKQAGDLMALAHSRDQRRTRLTPEIRELIATMASENPALGR